MASVKDTVVGGVRQGVAAALKVAKPAAARAPVEERPSKGTPNSPAIEQRSDWFCMPADTVALDETTLSPGTVVECNCRNSEKKALAPYFLKIVATHPRLHTVLVLMQGRT